MTEETAQNSNDEKFSKIEKKLTKQIYNGTKITIAGVLISFAGNAIYQGSDTDKDNPNEVPRAMHQIKNAEEYRDELENQKRNLMPEYNSPRLEKYVLENNPKLKRINDKLKLINLDIKELRESPAVKTYESQEETNLKEYNNPRILMGILGLGISVVGAGYTLMGYSNQRAIRKIKEESYGGKSRK